MSMPNYPSNGTSMTNFPMGPGYEYMKTVNDTSTLDSMQENFPVRNNNNSFTNPMSSGNFRNTNTEQMTSEFTPNLSNVSQPRGNMQSYDRNNINQYTNNGPLNRDLNRQ